MPVFFLVTTYQKIVKQKKLSKHIFSPEMWEMARISDDMVKSLIGWALVPYWS